MNEMNVKYYVYNDLRASRNGHKSECTYYESLEEVIKKFNELPKEWTTAIGVSINNSYDLDVIQRREGEPMVVTDYEKTNNPDYQKVLIDVKDELVNVLHVDKELLFGIHPEISCACKLDNHLKLDLYFENKVLEPIDMEKQIQKYRKLSNGDVDYKSLNWLKNNNSIDEIHVQGKGWLQCSDFVKLNENPYQNAYNPVVNAINVKYRDTKTGEVGYADVLPRQFLLLKEKTKEYLYEKNKLDNVLNGIEARRSNKQLEPRQSNNIGLERNQ